MYYLATQPTMFFDYRQVTEDYTRITNRIPLFYQGFFAEKYATPCRNLFISWYILVYPGKFFVQAFVQAKDKDTV